MKKYSVLFYKVDNVCLDACVVLCDGHETAVSTAFEQLRRTHSKRIRECHRVVIEEVTK